METTFRSSQGSTKDSHSLVHISQHADDVQSVSSYTSPFEMSQPLFASGAIRSYTNERMTTPSTSRPSSLERSFEELSPLQRISNRSMESPWMMTSNPTEPVSFFRCFLFLFCPLLFPPPFLLRMYIPFSIVKKGIRRTE